jgi:hypothetical protein
VSILLAGISAIALPQNSNESLRNEAAVSLSTSTLMLSFAHSLILAGRAGGVSPLALAQAFRSAAQRWTIAAL